MPKINLNASETAAAIREVQAAAHHVFTRPELLEEALGILKHHGKRTETVLQPVMLGDGDPALNTDSIPVPVSCGGVVLFVLDVDRNERY